MSWKWLCGRSGCGAVLAAMLLTPLLHAPVAAAALTFVAADGSDGNDCKTAATACASLQKAINKTDAGGTVRVLGAGSFGKAGIAKAISIVVDRVGTAVIATGNGTPPTGVYINAGPDLVDQQGSDRPGVYFASGKALHLSNCVLRNGGLPALYFAPTTDSRLNVADCAVDNPSGHGIWIGPTGAGIARAVLDRVRVQNSSIGILVTGNNTSGSSRATVRDSVVSGNTTGIQAEWGTAAVFVERTTISDNVNSGIFAQGGATVAVRLSDSTVTGNGTGLATGTTAQIISYETNRVSGNATDGNPTATVAHK